jgi:hypothetical protein
MNNIHTIQALPIPCLLPVRLYALEEPQRPPRGLLLEDRSRLSMEFWNRHRLALARDIWDDVMSKTCTDRVSTDLDTPRITGTSPGSRIQYETPLNVVPTSNAITSFRVKPLYGLRGSIIGI